MNRINFVLVPSSGFGFKTVFPCSSSINESRLSGKWQNSLILSSFIQKLSKKRQIELGSKRLIANHDIFDGNDLFSCK